MTARNESMKRYFFKTAVPVLFFLGAALAVSSIGVESPLAKRKKCTDCHKEIKALIKKGKAHEPAVKSCETCHKRHGFSQKLVLVKQAPELCFDCHKDVKKELEGKNVHGALTEGGCTICHDPHASKKKALLREAEGSPDICVTCHVDHKEKLAGESLHAPYKKKDCSVCHAPHSSSREHLLVEDEKVLCSGCHEDAAGKHDFPSFDKLACSDCHDPHLAGKKNPILAKAHEPFAEGSCDACHDTKDGEVLKIVDTTSRDMCAACHGDIMDLVEGGSGHFQDGGAKGSAACLSCHDPHKSSLAGLRLADDDDLCRKCHQDLPERLKYKGSMHPPFASGECTKCHDPHGGGGEYHLADDSQALCASCHEDKFAEPAEGETRHAALDMEGCLDCHSAHASKIDPLLKGTETQMCLGCHDKEEHASSHPPYATSSCTACHANHSGNEGLIASSDVNIVCAQCHRKEFKLTKAPVSHPPAAEDKCTSCHQAHGSENDHILASPERELCASCHDLDELAAGAGENAAGAVHEPAAEGKCGECHSPHGSTQEKLLVRSPERLCYGCHTQEKIDFAEGNIHDPVKKNDCKACHTPHGGPNPSLLVDAQPGVCYQCHDPGTDKLSEAHAGFDIAGTECTGCHDPHTSPSEKLLKQYTHPPFQEGSCEACHEGAGEGGALAKATGFGLPANSNELCLSCHDDKESGEGHQHAEGVLCTSCHTPHASTNEFLLKGSSDLCLSCHAKILEVPTAEGGGPMLHQPIKSDGCLKCHKMHEPVGKKYLAADENELCGSCHESVKERKGDLALHSPFKKGKCSSCHETHASGNEHLLKRSPEKICRTCHSLTSKKMRAKHQEMQLKGAGCITCHDPHSMKAAGSKLIPPNRHAPMAEGDCSACHDVLEQGKFDNSLCLECHDEGDGAFSDVHPGKQAKAQGSKASSCLACHSPHAGYENLLKRKEEISTCMQCHERKEFSRKFKHAALEQGCSVCHDLHKTNISELRSAKVIETCTSCHDDASRHVHPLGPEFKDPRNGEPLTCLSCHKPHSSDHEYLLIFDYRRDLCVQCHAGGTMKAH